MELTFRVAYTTADNTTDVSKFKYGKPMQDVQFSVPDHNGDTSLLRVWRRECIRLNKEFPDLRHWIDTEHWIDAGQPREHKI